MAAVMVIVVVVVGVIVVRFSQASSGATTQQYKPANDPNCYMLGNGRIYDDEIVANAINAYIANTPLPPNASSGANLAGKGSQFVSGARAAHINVFFMVGIAKVESAFGVRTPQNVVSDINHNSFGRTAAAGQPSQRLGDRNWYVWDSWDASLNGSNSEANFLRSAYLDLGYNTVDQVINRYAPPNENNTAAYISSVNSTIAYLTTATGSSFSCTLFK